jgi:hypothetical protein
LVRGFFVSSGICSGWSMDAVRPFSAHKTLSGNKYETQTTNQTHFHIFYLSKSEPKNYRKRRQSISIAALLSRLLLLVDKVYSFTSFSHLRNLHRKFKLTNSSNSPSLIGSGIFHSTWNHSSLSQLQIKNANSIIG